MSDSSDFIIENGVLKKYTGAGGDVVIPEGVTEIGECAFSIVEALPDGRKMSFENDTLLSVIMPDSVVHIADGAFEECENLQSVTFSSKLKTIGNQAFWRCPKLSEIIFPETLESIGSAAFFGHMTTKILEIRSKNLVLPEDKFSIFHFRPSATAEYVLFAPHLSLSVLKNQGLEETAAKTFLKRHQEYDPEVFEEYIDYISSHKKKYLSLILENDDAIIIKKLCEAGKINKKNFEKDYLLPAKQCGAENCASLLAELFGEGKNLSASVNQLWDGKFFSTNGKQLIKYKEESGIKTYVIPEGTKEICKDEFFMPCLDAVIIPESVIAIRNGAFVARGGEPLFIKLPDSLKKFPVKALDGGYYEEDDERPDSQKYYYVSTKSVEISEQSSCTSFSRGVQCPVYTGGPLDDLPPKVKPFAVKGFLYASEHGYANLTEWKDGYLDYIKNNEKIYLKIAEKNLYLLHLMIDEKLLSLKGVKALLKSEMLQNKVEAIASLLNYQNNVFPKK